MGLLGGKGGKKITVPQLTGLQIQTSVNALPIPIVYGSPRVPMNIIYSNGFRAVAQKQSGGKGIVSGGKGGNTTGYKYFATFLGALCEGQIQQVLVVFDDQQVYTPTTTPPGKVYFQFVGSPTQAPWSYIQARWPADAFTYKDTAYLGFQDYPLDASGTIPQLNFIPSGFLAGSSPLNLSVLPLTLVQVLADADPAEVIIDFLINPTYGAGFPFNFIDINGSLRTTSAGIDPDVGDNRISTYCQAIGMAWSVVLNNSEPASSVLERWCKNLGVAIVWTGSILKFIPYWDRFEGANPGYAGPPYTTVPLKYFSPTESDVVVAAFGPGDFVQTNEGEDPVTCLRVDPNDAKNVVRVDYRDRFNLFNDIPTEISDENQVELYGRRVERMATADEFTFLGYANVSAQIQLQRSVVVRNLYTFKLDMRWCILDPMDVVNITEPGLGLTDFTLRIRSIEEDEKGNLTIVGEEFPIGAASPTTFDAQVNAPATFAVTNEPAGAVNDPVIFEPTQAMREAQSQPAVTIAIGVSGGPAGVFDPNWGGCVINVSSDNVSYVDIGTQVGPSRHGVSTASLASYAGVNPDTGHTLQVNLIESQGTLQSVTALQASQGLSLCAVVEADGSYELLGYETATLTGPNAYDLTNLYRGLYGTVACTHASGSKFVFIDNFVFQGPLPLALIGTTVYVKLQSFNIYNNEVQDISTCTVYTYVPTGAGAMDPTNSLYLRLMNHEDTDLDGVNLPALDLNLGGGGACAPGLVGIDLAA